MYDYRWYHFKRIYFENMNMKMTFSLTSLLKKTNTICFLVNNIHSPFIYLVGMSKYSGNLPENIMINGSISSDFHCIYHVTTL